MQINVKGERESKSEEWFKTDTYLEKDGSEVRKYNPARREKEGSTVGNGYTTRMAS